MNTLTRADDARTWERFGRWGDAIGVCITCRLARVENRTSIFFFFFFFFSSSTALRWDSQCVVSTLGFLVSDQPRTPKPSWNPLLNKQRPSPLIDACARPAPCPTLTPNSPSPTGKASPSTESSTGVWRATGPGGSSVGRVSGLGSTQACWCSYSWSFWRGLGCVSALFFLFLSSSV